MLNLDTFLNEIFQSLWLLNDVLPKRVIYSPKVNVLIPIIKLQHNLNFSAIVTAASV
jgi:hypothetical protein